MRKRPSLIWLLPIALAACGSADEAAEVQQNKVETSGKEPVALADVPAPVLEAARAAQPELQLAEASSETRDGRNYYDLEGTLPDGSELELDLMEEAGVWRVVETQRDIQLETVAAPAREAFARAEGMFKPARIIESRQADGLIIYEFFDAAPEGVEPRKLEVKFDGTNAELLTSEWAH